MAKKKYKVNKSGIPIDKNLFYDGGYVYDSNYGLENVLSDLKNNEQNIINNYLEGQDKTALLQDAAKSLLSKNKTDWNSVASKGMAGLSGAMDIAQSTMANAKIKDTTGIQTAIDAAANTTFGGSTNEQLMAQYDAIEDLDRTSQRDLTGSVGSKLANTGKATLSGVQAGMQIGGPIGGIIGGAAGLISSGIGWIVGDTKAQNEAERLNKEAEAAEQRRLANFDLAVNNLEQQNLMYDMANYAKYGGPLFNEFSNGITKINEGGSHSENPYEGVQVGLDQEGIPNLVEEGELILGPEITKDNSSFVMSDSTKVSRGIRTKYKLRDNITHASAAKELTKMSEEMPNDPIVRRTKDVQLQELMIDQEQVKMKKDKNKRKNRFDYGGSIARLSPVFLSGGMALNDLLNGYEVDQSIFNTQKDAINAANVKVDSSPVKSNIEYTPLDTRSPLIEMSANRAATTRALMNTSGANPAIARTALTNADYNYNNQLSKLWRSIEEAEYNRRLGFEQFRTNVENANKARDLQAQSITADILNKQANLWRTHTSDLYNNERAVESTYSNNLNNFIQNLFDYGTEKDREGTIASLIKAGLLTDLEGKKAYNLVASNKKYGGKIKRKRRLS